AGQLATRPVELVPCNVAALLRPPTVPWATVMGLRLAADPTAGAAALDGLLAAEDTRMGTWAPTWWQELLRRVRVLPAGPDCAVELVRDLDRGVDLASAFLYLEAAQTEASRAHDHDAHVREEARLRRETWEAGERARGQGRPRAWWRAIRRVAPWLVGAVGLLVLHAAAKDEVPPRMVFVRGAAGVLAVPLWREPGLVAEWGGDYGRPVARRSEAARLRSRRTRMNRLSGWLRRLRTRRKI